MPEYLPFAGRNSIAEMNVGIQFALPFDSKVGDAATAIQTEFEADFPKYEPLQAFTFNFGLPQFPMPSANVGPNVSGFTLTKVKANGSPARVLRVMTNVMSVHFLEYSTWKEIKPQAIGYIKRCLTKLGLIERNAATSVLLRYIDRFTFDGPAQKATAAILFRPNTKFLPPRILDSGNQWHSNSGWFQPLIGNALVLNNLNISSMITQTISGVTVDHSIAYNMVKPCGSLIELMEGAGERPSLGEILDKQHDANADLLKDLLNQEMLHTIGLIK